MEEVWKDIHLSSLTNNPEVDLSAPTPINPNSHSFHHTNSNFTLQDFFSRPHKRDSSQPRFVAPSAPQNVLNLNTSPGFEFSESHDSVTTHGSPHFHSQNGSNGCTITSNRSQKCVNSAGSGRSNENSVDRRQKRMLKNRASAARSRLRKQAYTMELEQQSHRLEEENKRLKHKNKLLMIEKAVKIPERRPIFRTYSL